MSAGAHPEDAGESRSRPRPTAMTRLLSAEVGRPSAAALEKMGLVTVGDLLRHYPREYPRRGQLTSLADLVEKEVVTVVARVASVKSRPLRDGNKRLVTAVVTDGLADLDLTFFTANAWQAASRVKQLSVGTHALFAGKVGSYRGRRQLVSPEVEELPQDLSADELAERADAIVPVYRATEKFSSLRVTKAVATVLGPLTEEDLPDPVPREVLARLGMVTALQALRGIHAPASDAQLAAARRRLRFEEAFVLQVALARRRAALAGLPASPYLPRPEGALSLFDAALPFTLTAGQRSIGEAIAGDLARTSPMNRLLQGEVGSGKTLVALRAMLQVVDAGAQAALLAPTEVLAVQHHTSLTAALGPLADTRRSDTSPGPAHGVKVTLLTGALPRAARVQALLDITTGRAGIVVGTHALLQESVDYFDLGMVVIDEQHRFGVEQRDALRARSGLPPHVLVMTATPIPRTVAMTVFGDLEVSTLRELPVGRSPIATHRVPEQWSRWVGRVWQRVREEVRAGRQAYVVTGRIGELPGDPPRAATGKPIAGTPRWWARSAVLGHEEVKPPEVGDDERRPPLAVVDVADELAEHPAMEGVVLGLLHGRMTSEDKDAVMSAFARGEVDVLVATTVVEVGVDVPNATVMVVMDADRFGISQLHQLRGRIGRGEHPGTCFLVSGTEDDAAVHRLQAVEESSDGFVLATTDLETRSEGDVLGASQSGRTSSLRLLSVVKHEAVIETARAEASALVAGDPDLGVHPVLRAELAALDEEREAYLARG